jgi:dTMP kinase
LTILLEFDPTMSLGRARRRNEIASNRVNGSSRPRSKSQGDENRFEQQNRAFFDRVQQGYRAIAERERDRVISIDASGTPAQTHRRVLTAVSERLKLVSKDK